MPTSAIRNLIREDKIHQIYSSMQTGQEKVGMQTLNQSLATLFFNRQITMDTALAASSHKDELMDMINRGVGVVPGAGLGTGPARRRRRARGRPVGGSATASASTVDSRESTVEKPGVEPMATFAYTGRTRGGETVSGERVADTIEAATAALRRDQILVTKIAPAKAKAEPKAAGKAKGRGVDSKNLAVFTRQFSVMIDAGLPLVQCLDILGNQEEDKNFAKVILETRADVEGGSSLADAMKKHPKIFDALYTNMIAAGEAGGILDTILKRLAVYIEKNVKLKRQVKSAMIYPVAVIVHRRRRRGRHPLEGHPDVRRDVRRPRRRAAAAHPRRHLDERHARPLPAVHRRRASARLVFAVRQYYGDRQRPPRRSTGCS